MIRIGMLTSGGDCQALNAAMRGVAKVLLNSDKDVEIFGFLNGYKGLIYGDYTMLNHSDFSGILTKGGTILGSSRCPFKNMRDPDENGLDKVEAMKHNYYKLNLTCLVILGGNGTHKTANLLREEGLNVVTLPKTIDNDLWGTDMTFGFQSAVDIATTCIDQIHTTAASHGRVFIVEVMGHKVGQEIAHHVLRPALQRLLKHGVVGIGEAAAGDVLSLVPAQALLIDQDAHELGDGQRRMRIVDVEDNLIRQHVPVGAVYLLEVVQSVLNRRGGQEILLLEAQLLAFLVVVLRIQNLRDGLDQRTILVRRSVIAAVELDHIDGRDGAGRPGAQHVDHVAVIAQDRHVVGNSLHGVVVHQTVADAAVLEVLLDVAVEANLNRLVHAADFPGVAIGQPVVRQLDLIAVDNALTEQTQLVAEGAAHRRQLQSRQGIQEAGSKTAQTAVAQTGLGLALEDAASFDAQFLQRFHVSVLVDERDHVVVQGTAYKEFSGQIIKLLRLLTLALSAGSGTALHDLITDSEGQSLIELVIGSVRGFAAEMSLELGYDGLFDLIFGQTFHIHWKFGLLSRNHNILLFFS